MIKTVCGRWAGYCTNFVNINFDHDMIPEIFGCVCHLMVKVYEKFNKECNKCTEIQIPRLLCFLDSNRHENLETAPVSLTLKHLKSPQCTT